MNIVLTNHFRRRYKERIGHYSPSSVRRKIIEALKEFPPNIIQAKFMISDTLFVVAIRNDMGTWFIQTVGRHHAKDTSSNTQGKKAGSI